MTSQGREFSSYRIIPNRLSAFLRQIYPVFQYYYKLNLLLYNDIISNLNLHENMLKESCLNGMATSQNVQVFLFFFVQQQTHFEFYFQHPFILKPRPET
jgi:hypothetical protein